MSVRLPLRVRCQAWYLSIARRPRDERGNNSIEMAIIVGAVIVVATLIALAIKAAVDARLPGLK